jgi:hypothetical protein
MNITSRLQTWIAARHFAFVAAALALLLTLPALWNGWLLDDHAHRFVLLGSPRFPDRLPPPKSLFALLDGDPAHTARFMDIGVLPWWTYEQLRIAFWRPLSALTHWLDYQLWPDSPALMHLQSLLWLGAAVVVAAVLYRRLMAAPWVAGLAALLFAVDDAHALPAAWIANRNAVIAVTFGLLALLAHDRWRRAGWRPGAALGPFALLAALLSSEAAVGAGAYLLAYAVFLDPARWRGRLLALLPHVIVGLGWWLTYHGLGYGATGSGLYIDPAQDPLRFVVTAFTRGPLLLLSQWGFPPADLALILSSAARKLMWGWAIIYLVAVGLALTPLLRQNKLARFWTTGMLLALLPLCVTYPSERLLLLVGFGAMGLIAQFLGGWREPAGAHPSSRARRGLARILVGVFIVVHGVLAPLRLPVLAANPLPISPTPVQLAANLPNDPALTSQHLIIVNAPNAFYGAFLPVLRALDDVPVPAYTRLLAPGPQPLQLTRVDEHTLTIRPELGIAPPPGTPRSTDRGRRAHLNFAFVHQYFDRLYRDDAHPMTLGQRVELTGLSVEVTALTPDGRPAEACFRFSVPLEHPSLRWVQCRQGAYVPFTPPAIGQTVRLEPASGYAIH